MFFFYIDKYYISSVKHQDFIFIGFSFFLFFSHKHGVVMSLLPHEALFFSSMVGNSGYSHVALSGLSLSSL